MLYLLVDWVRSEEGFCPDLPVGCSFLCLAGSARDQPFGLFEVADLSEEDEERLQLQRVPHSLAVLLASCRSYPPALAGAVQDLVPSGFLPRERFVKELERHLRERLEEQRAKPHLLARSRVCEPGYRDEGEFVWVVAYHPERVGREVAWVSSDYQVYSDAVSTFDLDTAWLVERFRETGQAGRTEH